MKEKANISIFHKFTERVLIFFTINSFFCCLLFMIRDIGKFTGTQTVNLFTIALICIFALLIYAIQLIFFSEKSSTANFVRLVFFYTIFCGGIVVLLRHFIYFSGIVVVLCTIIHTILYKKILEAFFAHDIFEKQCHQKNNVQLQKELYDYNIYLADAAAGYRQNRSILLILMAIILIGTTIFVSTEYELSFISLIFIYLFLVCVFCNFFLYSHYVREATFASNGFVNVFDYRLKIFFTCIFICTVCFLVGLLLSSNHALIKLSWLKNLFHKKAVFGMPSAPVVELDPYEQRLAEIRAYQMAVQQNGDNKSGTFLGIFCGLFFVVCIVWFFIKPIVTKVLSQVLRDTDIKGIIKRFFKTLGQVFWKLFHLKKQDILFTSQNAVRFKEDMAVFLKSSKKSKEKKAELDRLTQQFMKIIDWGEQNGFTYTKNLAPAEYTHILKNKHADLAGQLFEQALYAKECLTKTEEEDFITAVEAVVKVVAV